MFESAAQTALKVAALLLLVILLEEATPRTKVSLRDRFPVAIYRVGLASLIVMAGWPLSLLWGKLGIQPLFSLRELHPALGIAAAILILDFLRYVEHRLEHRFWWPVHSLHHAQTNVHASSVYAHPLIAIPEFIVIAVPLSFINIGVVGFGVLALVSTFQDFVIHSPLRVHLGPLRRVFVDNRFHRIHHSLEEPHFGKNFGLMFTLWDQMFGTAYFPAKDEWPDTGVEGVRSPRTFADILTHPVRFMMAGRKERGEVSMSLDLVPNESAIGGG